MNENISWGKIGVLVIVIIGIASVAFVMGKKSNEGSLIGMQIPISENKTLKEKEGDVSQGYMYKNGKLGVSFQFPPHWTSVIQNDTDTLSDIYFFDSAYGKEVIGSDNPLVVLIDKNIEHIGLEVNANEFVGKPDFTVSAMKDFIAPKSINGPDGKGGWAEIKQTLSNWRAQQLQGGQTVYFYTSVYGSESRSGAAWISKGRLFQIENNMKDRQNEFESIVLSFSEKM